MKEKPRRTEQQEGRDRWDLSVRLNSGSGRKRKPWRIWRGWMWGAVEMPASPHSTFLKITP